MSPYVEPFAEVQRPEQPLADGPEMARWVLDVITAHPEQHDQADFENTWSTPCGTIHCIAGWVNWADGRDSSACHAAAKRLGLAQMGMAQHFLFYSFDNAEAVRALRFLADGNPAGMDSVIAEHRRRTLGLGG